MSKYIKLEDALKEFNYGTDYPVNTIIDILYDLPTIEVSEDCISREQVRAKLDYISYAEKDPISIAKRIVDNAPSVVPTTEPQTDCEGCEHWKYIAHEWQCETEKCQKKG